MAGYSIVVQHRRDAGRPDRVTFCDKAGYPMIFQEPSAVL